MLQTMKKIVLLWGPLFVGPCSAEHAEHAYIRLWNGVVL